MCLDKGPGLLETALSAVFSILYKSTKFIISKLHATLNKTFIDS